MFFTFGHITSFPMNTVPVTKEAQLVVLETELAEVRWLAQHGADDQLKAAASLRVLHLQKEIRDLKAA